MNARMPAEAGLLPGDLAAAVEAAARYGRPVATLLRERPGSGPAEVLALLGRHFDLPTADLARLQDLSPDFGRVGFADAQARGVMAATDGQGGRWLVLTDPFDTMTETWACNRLGGQAWPILLADPDELRAQLAQHEHRQRAMDRMSVSQGGSGTDEAVADITLASLEAESSEVVRLVNSTLFDALRAQASDIHLESDAGAMRVKYRIDGVLVGVAEVAGQDLTEQVISRIKVMAELDIAERRIPQDGRFKVRVNGRSVDFRVSVMPNIFGEDAVLRLLDRRSLTDDSTELTLDHLGLDTETMRAVRALAARPHGMLLMTGPTGSGKTTTLYALISEIHTGRDKIVTIEDPVEYRLRGVLQIPVNERKGLGFARGLRSILRHDPDKIMVGEIRDGETAQIAVQAALTGHLVLTTVHANNVFDVLGRFLHMGVDAYSFAAALNGIVAQRLLRTNCTRCSQPAAPEPSKLEAAGLAAAEVVGWRFMAGRGCAHCRGTGYKGRRAVAEVLVLDDTMREIIAAKAPVSGLKERAQRQGLRSMRDVVLDMVRAGHTTLEEMRRVVG